MRTVNVEASKLPDGLLNTIAEGEIVLITREENPVAILSPVSVMQSAVTTSQSTSPESQKIQRRLGTAKGLIWMSDDFNEPLDDFTGYKP
jgi:antitoxin (DNA-binding transcriptional repressor) of toxin-antitoxin stability system